MKKATERKAYLNSHLARQTIDNTLDVVKHVSITNKSQVAKPMKRNCVIQIIRKENEFG